MSTKFSTNSAQMFYSDEIQESEAGNPSRQEVSIGRLKELINELDNFLGYLDVEPSLENQLEHLRPSQDTESFPIALNGVRGKKAAFNGMRGKKAAFNGMRGRRAAFVGMRGKRAPFNGMRGKRSIDVNGKKLEVPVSPSEW